jgi:hypothetical protein
MEATMKKYKRIIISLIVFIGVFVLINLISPFLKPIYLIEKDILKITPYGMSMNDVYKAIENERYWIINKNIESES